MIICKSTVSPLAVRIGRPLLRILPLGLLILCIAVPVNTEATECIDYTSYIDIISTITLPGETTDVGKIDNHIVVISTDALRIIDVRDSDDPQTVSELEISNACSMAMRDNYVFVACHTDDFRIVDISDLTAPWICGSLPVAGNARDVEIDGDFAYIAADEAGMHIFDISDPTDPTVFTTVDTPHYAQDIAIQGRYAFIADMREMVVIDLDDIPTKRGSVGNDRPGPSINSVTVSGNYAYTLDSNFGIYIYDITDPLDPQYVSQTDGGGFCELKIVDDLLFTGCGWGLQVIDVHTPEMPLLLGKVMSGGSPQGIEVDGDTAYITNAYPGSLCLIDISNPTSPEMSDEVFFSGWIVDITFADDIGYLSCRYAGLQILNAENPHAMMAMGRVPDVLYSRHCIVDGDYAYIAGESEGIYIADISTPAKPELVSGFSLSRNSSHLAKRGDLLYVANGDGLRILDVADPFMPTKVGMLNTEGYSRYIAITGNHVLLSTSSDLLLIDVSIPSAPTIIETLRIYPKRVAFKGDLAYISTANTGIEIYSIANLPEFPYVNSVRFPGYPLSFAFSEDLVYMACHQGGVQIFDVSSPEAPVQVSGAPHWSAGIVVGDEDLYLASANGVGLLPLHCTLTGLEEQPGDDTEQPLALARLHQNRPNPFNPSTMIGYTLTGSAVVSLRIYDINGRLVRTLCNEITETAGLHELRWLGLDDRGNRLSSGAYLYRLEVDNQVFSRRMLLLK
ncbi:MAG: T9SS type A sorting domain-containing protein [bacterium]|nr:T9SS type A sorting domain-containing protein [bacterium]